MYNNNMVIYNMFVYTDCIYIGTYMIINVTTSYIFARQDRIKYVQTKVDSLMKYNK